METTNTHHLNVLTKLLLLIIDYVPEVTLLLNFKSLNKSLRQSLVYKAYPEIWHKNASKVKDDFIV